MFKDTYSYPKKYKQKHIKDKYQGQQLPIGMRDSTHMESVHMDFNHNGNTVLFSYDFSI